MPGHGVRAGGDMLGLRSAPLVGQALGLALTLLVAAGCDDENRRSAVDERLPLPGLELPLLSCAAAVASAGECSRNDDCGTGQRCVLRAEAQALDGEPPELTCAPPVGTSIERDRCELGESCESGLCALSGVCLEPCAEARDCERGQVCQAVHARIEGGLVPLMACARGTAFPVDVQLERAPRIEGLSPDAVTLVDLPRSARNTMFFLRTACDARPVVVSLRSLESGQQLFDLGQLLQGERPLNPVLGSSQAALVPMLVPNNPALRASGSGYELGIATELPSGAELLVATRQGRGKRLDLNVFYVGGGEATQRGGFEAGSREVGGVIEELGARYRALGIALGRVREYDVPGALREELSVLELDEVFDDEGRLIDLRLLGLERLFELSAGVDDGGINLFLVSDMSLILGISGGVPGALGVHGTSVSGVAVALDTVGLERAAQVILHETAHQLGLFHTSEQSGLIVEPLADTPECTVVRDSDGNGVVEPSECRGHGADNLMFWAGQGGQVSDDQRAVLQSSLILR